MKYHEKLFMHVTSNHYCQWVN